MAAMDGSCGSKHGAAVEKSFNLDAIMASPIINIAILSFLACSYLMPVYFIVLGLAIATCHSRPVGYMRRALSTLCVAVTWFYIIRFMMEHEGAVNAFDAAYADVVWGGSQGNWTYTQTLLCWAVVATVWSADASICFTLFGVLGAMSGSYLLYMPNMRPSNKASAFYVIFSVLAFISIIALPCTTTYSALGWWLWLLHVAIIAPKLLSPLWQRQVEKDLLYSFLAVICFLVHMSAGRSPLPITDCQISITVDAVVCACITIAFIYNRSQSAALACLSAAMAPLLSPGCVHALFCAFEHGIWARCVYSIQLFTAGRLRAASILAAEAVAAEAATKKKEEQEQVEERRPSTRRFWTNLGYWKGTQQYDKACSQMAKLLAEAASLQNGDRLLCVGCGAGEELRYLSSECNFQLREAAGLDPCVAQSPLSDVLRRLQARLLAGGAEDMLHGKSLVCQSEFNRILAVDSIYHVNKDAFFRDCMRLLPQGGSLAVSDVLLKKSAPLWVRGALVAMGIPWANHWTDEEYRARLAAVGLASVEVKSLEPYVLGSWFPKWLTAYLDYAVVSASKSEQVVRPTAAVVGSGLSGLAAARLLSQTHEVTVFEAREEPNLAGWEAKLPNGSVVDIPLRMIEHNYWHGLVAFCNKLGVPLVSTNFTVSLYGPTGTSHVNTGVGSQWRNIFLNVKWYVGLLLAALQLVLWNPREGESLGDFAKRLGQDQSDFYKVGVLRHLSWIMSCTYAMAADCPVALVRGFFQAILGNFFQSRNPTVRVFPSVRRLQDVLLLGSTLKTHFPVPAFTVVPKGKDDDTDAREDDDRGTSNCIAGKAFDAVVIATEAAVVSKILPRDWTSCFDEFQYHPSHVIVHRDPALMPGERSEWRAVNVCDDKAGEACQITVWVNAYYDNIELGGDVFETVNPCTRPRADLIIRECHLQRVVHTTKSQALQEQIEALQGREGFFFCGAYCVPGLGLLEQALRSAEVAVQAVNSQAAGNRKCKAPSGKLE